MRGIGELPTRRRMRTTSGSMTAALARRTSAAATRVTKYLHTDSLLQTSLQLFQLGEKGGKKVFHRHEEEKQALPEHHGIKEGIRDEGKGEEAEVEEKEQTAQTAEADGGQRRELVEVETTT